MTTDFGEAQNDASSAYWHCPPSYGLASRRRPIARDPIQRCAAAGAPERGYLECGSTIVDLHSTWPLAVVSLGGIVDRGPAVAADRGRTGNFLLFSDDDAFTRPPRRTSPRCPPGPQAGQTGKRAGRLGRVGRDTVHGLQAALRQRRRNLPRRLQACCPRGCIWTHGGLSQARNGEGERRFDNAN